ncbi:hypothetical protein ABZ642_42200 [Streptomyces sp. NPDC007157]|uniref:hypothetical protein n=1 Tax=Streptomyces sp. NPDC007157 TaxID=3154681 RepID=UPI00340F8EED
MRNLLTRRASGYAQAEVDAWFADALATGRGHYADPAARQAAATEQQPFVRRGGMEPGAFEGRVSA